MPGDQCTWTTMKQKFRDAHRNILVKLTIATGAGYHNVNAENDAAANNYCCGHAKALTNFETVTKFDCVTICRLVNTSRLLTTQLATVTGKVADSFHKIALLCSNTQPNTQF